MSGLEWVLTLLLWVTGMTAALMYHAFVEACGQLDEARRPQPRMTRQESTDKLPISLALYGAWTRYGLDDEATLEAVKAAVRELHPDLGTALDRTVETYVARANLVARTPSSGPVVPVPSRPACDGPHVWRRVEGMGVDRCDACGAMQADA